MKQQQQPCEEVAAYAARALDVAGRAAGANGDQLKNRNWRLGDITLARWAVIVCLNWRGLGLSAIARLVGVDHSSVAYALRQSAWLDWAPGSRFRMFLDMAARA